MATGKDKVRPISALLLLIFCFGCAAPKRDESLQSTRNARLRGEINDLVAYYEAKAQEAEKKADWITAAGAFEQAANHASSAGQLQKGIVFGLKALDIAQRTKTPVYNRVNPSSLDNPPLPELMIISTLIRIYMSLRDFGRAESLIERGLSLVAEVPDATRRLDRQTDLYGALGRNFRQRGEHGKARDAYLQAIALGKNHVAARRGFPRLLENSETRLTGLYVDLGRVYERLGQFDDALEQYREASRYIEMGGTRVIYAQTIYLGFANLYLQQKQYSLALENFHKALALFEKQRIPSGIRSASTGVAKTLRSSGKPAEAIPYYQQAIQQTESTRSLLQSQDYRQSFFEGGLNDYVEIIGSLSEAARTEDSFSYNERARSRVFLDLLGSKIQLSRRQSGFGEEEKALQEQIAAIQATLAGQEDDDAAGVDNASLRKQLAEAEAGYSNFLSRVKRENKEQASLMSVEPLVVAQVQRLLDPGVSLLEYFVTPNATYLWVLDKEQVSSVQIPINRKALFAEVNGLRESISQLDELSNLRQQSQELYQQLVAPALPHIRGKELIIVPHDVLHYLPFQALQSTDGRYLIEKYPISYLSSASLMQFTQEKRKTRGELKSLLEQGGKVLTFGNPDLGDPRMSLAFAGVEAKEIKSLYPQSTIYLERDATEEKAKALVSDSDIIHFASHAELNENDPLSSAVLLAKSDKDDGRLAVREIFGMELKASLVVLSACETGLGKLSSGDELVGLTRAFIYAGTPSVVASLWNVEDSSTAQLMASFYKNLKTMSKAKALREAQLELIRGQTNTELLARRGIGGVGKLGGAAKGPVSQPAAAVSTPPESISVSTSHPYFWAPFILVGEGN